MQKGQEDGLSARTWQYKQTSSVTVIRTQTRRMGETVRMLLHLSVKILTPGF